MTRNRHLFTLALLAIALSCFLYVGACAQGGFFDDRVMLQGFYWESHRHGYPDKFPQFGKKKWYEIVNDEAGQIRDGRFDLIWLPPPSLASYPGSYSAGYGPKEYFNLSNCYGSFDQHRAMLVKLLESGIEPIADIVINHRDGSKGWADFKNPDWGPWAICRTDEAFSDCDSEVKCLPEDQRGAEEERPEPYARHPGTTYRYNAFRDLDHTNKQVRRDIITYLLQLRSMGYRGWRYDMVHGYHARWVAVYNRASKPTFAVGEYDWGRHDEQRGWIWHTATAPGDLRTSCCAFDFATFFTLKDNKSRYGPWYGYGYGLGLIGDTTDGLPWKNKAVTFVENHDTGYRTKEDGTPEDHHGSDSFANNWEVEQAYAYILTHPGIPCVFWKHYFDWGDTLRERIKALINARKVAGVHSGSALHVQENARQKSIYAAMVEGRDGRQLYVRIGGSDSDWQPFFSNYDGYREYAQGTGWKVWVKLPGNPEVQQAPVSKATFPVPDYQEPSKIKVPNEWLN